jgi:hypothetical protein
MIDEEQFQPPPRLLAPIMAETRALGFMAGAGRRSARCCG